MKVIFATTNERKVEDLINVIKDEKLNIEILSLANIGWNLGEIDETGLTIEENSLIKANAVLSFCKNNNINYPIISDDAGLFVDALGGEPGVYTARYADEELKQNPELPKHYVLLKMLDKMSGQDNRTAEYRCAVTVMFNDGSYEQFVDKTRGFIAKRINEPIKKPYFYSLFIEKQTGLHFNELNSNQLKETYRFKALKKALKHINELIMTDKQNFRGLRNEDLERV